MSCNVVAVETHKDTKQNESCLTEEQTSTTQTKSRKQHPLLDDWDQRALPERDFFYSSAAERIEDLSSCFMIRLLAEVEHHQEEGSGDHPLDLVLSLSSSRSLPDGSDAGYREEMLAGRAHWPDWQLTTRFGRSSRCLGDRLLTDSRRNGLRSDGRCSPHTSLLIRPLIKSSIGWKHSGSLCIPFQRCP